jgi:GNAT superfamily N-acetyltransferase
VIRPLTQDDVPAVYELMCETFEDHARKHNQPVRPRPDYEVASIRPAHLIHTDPDGSWGAEEDGRLVSAGLALKREGLWGLSLLVTHPDHQSKGVGTGVLNACHAYADDARGRIILTSTDPRAIRAYARLGLDVHASLTGSGHPRGVSAPPGVRTGNARDIAFTTEVDRHVRGAARGEDIDAMLQMGLKLLIAEERGYAVYGSDGEVRIVAAYDERAAADLLKAALVQVEEATVLWMTESQQWAIRVCVDAGLELRTAQGAVCVAGEVGPFQPYLPHGAFL